jgi:integrase
MARTVNYAKLENPTARKGLKPAATRKQLKPAAGKRKKPEDFRHTLVPQKVHLGWRRGAPGQAGQWFVRTYLGKTPNGDSQYRIALLGLADDLPGAGMTFEEAQDKALAHPLVRGEEAVVVAALTVADVMAEYVKWLKKNNRATAQDAELRAAKLILPTLGKFKVTALTTLQLNRWRDALAEAPPLLRTKAGTKQQLGQEPTTDEEKRARRASANRVLTTLKAALNKAFNDDLVKDDAVWRKVKPFDGVDAARPGYLTMDESLRLINAADAASGFRDLVRGALETGARYGELCAMRCRDFARGKIHIPRSKSGKPRDIVLTEEGATFFESMTIGHPPSALIFTRADGSAWAPSHQARPMFDACRAAHIEPPIGFHALRHTVASHAVMNGVPLMIVARNLGHSSTVMLEKNYSHLASSYVDDAIRRGAPRFGGVEPQSNVVPMVKTKT